MAPPPHRRRHGSPSPAALRRAGICQTPGICGAAAAAFTQEQSINGERTTSRQNAALARGDRVGARQDAARGGNYQTVVTPKIGIFHSACRSTVFLFWTRLCFSALCLHKNNTQSTTDVFLNGEIVFFFSLRVHGLRWSESHSENRARGFVIIERSHICRLVGRTKERL